MAEREQRRGDPIDAVAIVTPNNAHAAAACAFLRAGIHVICDKPLTTSRRDAEPVGGSPRRAVSASCGHPQLHRLSAGAAGPRDGHGGGAWRTAPGPGRVCPGLAPRRRSRKRGRSRPPGALTRAAPGLPAPSGTSARTSSTSSSSSRAIGLRSFPPSCTPSSRAAGSTTTRTCCCVSRVERKACSGAAKSPPVTRTICGFSRLWRGREPGVGARNAQCPHPCTASPAAADHPAQRGRCGRGVEICLAAACRASGRLSRRFRAALRRYRGTDPSQDRWPRAEPGRRPRAYGRRRLARCPLHRGRRGLSPRQLRMDCGLIRGNGHIRLIRERAAIHWMAIGSGAREWLRPPQS